MATQFTDIYIDGITTEELHADGGQIVEAWLDGECIWRLISGMEYQREICCWARHDGTYYGFGLYATKENPLYNNWIRIYFKGNDIENMECTYVTASSGVSDLFGNMTILRCNPISVYDFGICVHTMQSTGNIYLMNVSALQGYDIKSTLAENSVKVNELLGNGFTNISDPLGTECNVFNNKYQIAGATISSNSKYDGAKARILNTIDNTYTDVKFEPTRPQPGTPEWTFLYSEEDHYGINGSAYMNGKIFFSIRKGIAQEYFRKISYIPWLYMDGSNLTEIKRLKIDITRYTHYNGNASYDHVITDLQGTSISADRSRVVLGMQLTVEEYPRTGESVKKNVLCEYKNGIVSQCEVDVPYDSFFPNAAVKIVGEYIVICKKNTYRANNEYIYILAGKSINNMTLFNASERGWMYCNPKIFYEEDGELYYDAIYTPPENYTAIDISNASLHGTGTSMVVKRKVNFKACEVETVEAAEIDGRLEE